MHAPDLPETELSGPDIADAEVVVISDGRAGHVNQSVGVAEMLGFKDPEVMTLVRAHTSRWLGWLPVEMLFANYAKIAHEIGRMGPQVVVIGAGTQVSRVLRKLKRADPRLFTVCLMRPAGKPADYDVVAVPKHDNYKKQDNVVVTLGAANRITRDKLAQEADRWKKRLAPVTSPRLALLVGGTSKHGGFGRHAAQEMMLAVLEAARKKGLGLLVTTSRRTGEDATEAVATLLQKSGIKHHFWSPDDEAQRDNPYLAYLGLSDAVVVTAESVSMVCEAASSGRPVYLWGQPKKLPRKLRALYEGLMKQGRAKWWDGSLTLRPPAAGLMDTLMIAGFVRARWNKRMAGGR
ncbi:MAG: hypothetical protein GC129_06570 [Proteobacteria bacterium]|nr:hypothetical protein [Pseudomonadota bacterium]